MNCPHCGASYSTSTLTFACGSYERSDGIKRHAHCFESQISQLKAELAQSVRRDDPRLKETISGLERASRCSMSALAIAMLDSVKDKLQSIIEGK